MPGVGQAHGAVLLERQGQAGHGAGHPGGTMGETRPLRDGIAVFVLEHGLGGGGRRGLAIVDGDDFVAVLVGDQHEAAAADIAGARLGNGQGEAGGDRGIHGVAAVGQDIPGNL